MPTNDSFVHSVYMNCAKQIYTNPYLYSLNNYDPITDNTNEVYEIIEKATLDTIRNLLPLKSILDSYLGNALSSDDESDSDESELEPAVEEPPEEDPLLKPKTPLVKLKKTLFPKNRNLEWTICLKNLRRTK